ncbi:MAG: biotin--[acetyl-CoA-carboxylase] ligase [Trueperaceae bacterium]
MSGAPVEQLPEWRVEAFGSVGSTQAVLKERLQQGADVHGVVIRATEQLAGRGRRANGWESAVGGSYQSLALEDRWQGALRSPSITLLLAVELAEELRGAGADVRVKWPNDLYLGEGKLGGILCEYLRGHLVAGVGINVGNPVPEGAGALEGWSLGSVNHLVLRAARAAFRQLLESGAGESGLGARYARLDFLSERDVSVVIGGTTVTGSSAGVDANGALVLRTADGEVTVRDGTVANWSRVD